MAAIVAGVLVTLVLIGAALWFMAFTWDSPLNDLIHYVTSPYFCHHYLRSSSCR